MINFLKITFYITILMFLNISINAEPVKFHTKKYNDTVAFVFYHTRAQDVNLNVTGNLVIATVDKPDGFQIIDKNIFNKFVKNINISSDNKSISFLINTSYNNKKIIDGERLTAVEFYNVKDLSNTEDKTKIEDDKKNINNIDNSINDKATDDIIKLNDNQKDQILSFDFNTNNVGMAAFFRGKYLWLVFDKPKIFNIKNNNIINDFKQIDSVNNTILRFKLNDESYNNILVAKKNKTWKLIITKSIPNIESYKHVLQYQILADKLSINLEKFYHQDSSKIIDIKDELIGDDIKVLTFTTPNVMIDNNKSFMDFNLLKTIQGVAISIHSDDSNIKLDTTSDQMSIYFDKDEKIVKEKNKEVTKTEFIKLNNQDKSILPIQQSVNDNDFLIERTALMDDIISASNINDLFIKRLNLAKFFFINELYNESSDVLELIQKQSKDFINNDLRVQFLTAVNYTIIGKYDLARNIYNTLINKIDPQDTAEIILWNKYNEFLDTKNPVTIDFISNIKLINQYPNNLYWKLALAELDILSTVNNIKNIETLIKELRDPPIGFYADSLQFYKAIYYNKKKQYNLAKKFLQELVNKNSDPLNYVRASFELTKLQIMQKEITKEQAINILENIRYIWRDEVLENNILLTLSQYYKEIDKDIDALRIYHYMNKSFKKQVSDIYITSEMVKIFNSIFLPNGRAKNMSPFDVVSLFYEFEDINPVGEKGDEVILLIAKKLIELDLLDKAVDILKHQVSYRLTGDQKIITSNHLAIALLINKKPQEAIQVLDDTDLDNFKFNEHQYRIRLKANALINIGKYSEALDSLSKDYSEDAILLKKEALFLAESFNEYVDLVSPMVQNAINQNIYSEAIEQDILRLAISYYILNDQSTLNKLSKSIDWDKYNKIKTTIDLLLTTSKPIDYKDLDQSLSINQIQNLLNKYKNELFN